MAKEKNLTTVTTVAAADFARLVTSAGASVKATAANLAKYIIETYNGSTVAGSAQSVKSALDSLNSKSLRYVRSITSADDCNELTQGVYIYSNSVPQNAPTGTQYATLIVIEGTFGTSAYNFQLLSTSGRGLYYRRQQGQIGEAFSAWTKVTGTQV